MPTNCWCGNAELLEYSEDYSRCDSCFTLVNNRIINESIYDVKNESNDLYGANYWFKNFLDRAKMTSINELNDHYLVGRCLYWMRCVLKYILPPAKVVEFGGGLGQMLYLMKHAGFNQVGIELSQKVCEYARSAFNINMLSGTIDDLKGVYDAVLLFDVVEHLTDPVAFFIQLKKQCKTSILYLSV